MPVSSRHTSSIVVAAGGSAAAIRTRSSSGYGSLTMPSGRSTRLSPSRVSSAAAASIASYDVPDIRPITRTTPSTPLLLVASAERGEREDADGAGGHRVVRRNVHVPGPLRSVSVMMSPAQPENTALDRA